MSINGFNSNLPDIKCRVPQGYILGTLMFLVCIDSLHCAIIFCKVHHFGDDTNLINFQNSVKIINKTENLSSWLSANSISVNVSKRELLMFKPPKKQPDHGLKIKKLNGKNLY